jgi:hydrogenase maturation factor HypF (carbamoyltransferase family)
MLDAWGEKVIEIACDTCFVGSSGNFFGGQLSEADLKVVKPPSQAII